MGGDILENWYLFKVVGAMCAFLVMTFTGAVFVIHAINSLLGGLFIEQLAIL